jgi:hypothetical protein
MKLPVVLALFLGALSLHAQVLLTVDLSNPFDVVITATGNEPVTTDATHNFFQGFELEGLLAPGTSLLESSISSTLTTGDSSTGAIYDDVTSDSLSQPGADLNIYYGYILTPTESFTLGHSAFAAGTSIHLNLGSVSFTNLDYGVIVAGDANNSPVPIGVYHVIGNAAPEPSTYAMIFTGALALAFIARRKQAVL